MGMMKKLARRGKARPMETAREASRQEANGYMCCLTMAWLHIRRGYGKKRIKEAFEDYCRFFQDMENAGTTTGDFISLLREECGFDPVGAFARLEKAVLAEEAEWQRAAREQAARMDEQLREARQCRR